MWPISKQVIKYRHKYFFLYLFALKSTLLADKVHCLKYLSTSTIVLDSIPVCEEYTWRTESTRAYHMQGIITSMCAFDIV